VPLHGISASVVFPQLIRSALAEAQAGWALSDEGLNGGGGTHPVMFTTKMWQLLFWMATRHGAIDVSISGLFLRKRKPPSIMWKAVAKNWPYMSKSEARKHANSRIAMLTLYLGDGKTDGGTRANAFRISVGNSFEKKPRSLAAEIIRDAYAFGYGQLLDILQCEKWEALKRLSRLPPTERRRSPVYAEIACYRFRLAFDGSKLYALATFKSEEEAEKCFEELEKLAVKAAIYRGRTRQYYYVALNAHEILKLAMRYTEWRRALREFFEKRRLEPTTPLRRKLLELAESPPLPSKTYKSPPFLVLRCPGRLARSSRLGREDTGLSSRRTRVQIPAGAPTRCFELLKSAGSGREASFKSFEAGRRLWSAGWRFGGLCWR
jgi:hypothetical protein